MIDDPYFEELSKNMDHYVQEVLRPFWKNIQFKSRGGVYAPGTRCDYFEADTSVFPKLFEDTPIEYNGDYKFLHYTSLKGLLSILRSKSLRLHDFNSFEDPLEFVFANNFIRNKESSELIEYKKQLFGLSLCQYSEDLVNNNIDLWRLYGDNGFGACLELECDKKSLDSSYNFTFGKIAYEPQSTVPDIDALIARARNFEKKNNFKLSNLEEVITPISCFYKSSLYQIEKEVRLFTFRKRRFYDDYERPEGIHSDINNRFNKIHYIDIPIKSSEKLDSPLFTIKKIHLGYNIRNETVHEVQEVIAEHARDLSQIIIGRTPIWKRLFSR